MLFTTHRRVSASAINGLAAIGRPLTLTQLLLMRILQCAALVCAVGSVCLWIDEPANGASGPEPTFEWVRKYGTSASDAGRGLAVDSLGNVYMSGHTDTSSNPSRKDIYITGFDPLGTLRWSDPLVTNTGSTSNGISTDVNGNVFVAATTNQIGAEDLLVRKYNSQGGILWSRQLGTPASDFGVSAATDSFGSVFVTGYTLGDFVGTDHVGWDGFVVKYDAAGTHQWTRQFGTDFDDHGINLCTDSLGNIYITGTTGGSFGGPNSFPSREDVYVTKYSGTGDLVWTRQIGTSAVDYPVNIAFDGAGAIYVAGSTAGSLGGVNLGGEDAFLTKIDLAGDVKWTQQLGTSSEDIGFGVAVANSASIYLAGSTRGSLAGSNFGSTDAFLAAYNSAGNLTVVQQFGTAVRDSVYGVAVDSAGNLYLSGTSSGNFAGVLGNAGDPNAFLAKISAVPEPSALGLLPATLLTLQLRRRR